jgi:survival of motor neuron-related-splicing factor 30
MITVGFTGSGQTMRKDPARSRHIYQTNGDDEAYQ